MKKALWSSLALAASSLALPAGAGEIGADLGFWRGSLSGDVKAQSNSIPATRLSYGGLGMDTDKTIVPVELFYRWGETGNHRVSMRYFEQTFKGQTVLTQTVTFKTFTFAASSTLNSEMTLKDFDLDYQGDLWQEPHEKDAKGRPSAFWWTGGLKLVDMSASLSASGVGTVHEGETAPIPVLGFGGRWNLPHGFSLDGGVSGLVLDVSGVKASFYELVAETRWAFSENSDLSLGWRRWRLGADIDSGSTKVDFTAQIQGLYLGLEHRF